MTTGTLNKHISDFEHVSNFIYILLASTTQQRRTL